MRKLLKRLLTGDEAQDLVEYSLLVAFVGIALLAIFLSLQNAIGAAYVRVDGAEQDLGAETPPPW